VAFSQGMKQRKKKLKEELRSFWFIPLRLSIFLLLFGAVVLSESTQRQTFWPFLLYSLATLVFLLVIEVDARFFRPGVLRFIIFFHFVFELLAEASILRSAGQLTSQYSILFLLTIVSASLVYRLVGTITIATLAAFTYALASSLSRVFESGSGMSLEQFRITFQGDDVFYATFLHVCTFYLVAFISGFLAQKLRAKEGELSHASEELERVQLDTDDILQNLHSGLVTIDSTGKIVYFNRAAETILGYRHIDVKGKNFLEVFNRQMPEFCERVLSVLKLAKPGMRSEIEITCKNGVRMPLGLNASVLGDERVGIRGVVAVFQDLTIAKEMEQALLKADRLAAVGELSARIAHEIRNPLASISGSVEVLKSEIALQGDNARLMELIVKESERLSRILTDFLSYARTSPVLSTKIEIVSIIGETIDLMRNSQKVPKGVQLEFATDQPTEYIIGEEDQVRQIIINVINNALDAVDQGDGRIAVKVGGPFGDDRLSQGDWVLVTIIDNGSGFDHGVKEKLFEPFFSRKKGGTGLGLAIVKRCLDNIGGHISVDSAPGAGAKFRLYFRRYVQSRDDNAVVSPTRHPESSTTVA
jgi:two-component system sensor histidine kinase PilS (NtrC family)